MATCAASPRGCDSRFSALLHCCPALLCRLRIRHYPFIVQACSLLGQVPLPPDHHLALPSTPTSWSIANTQYPEQQPFFIYGIDQKVRSSFSHKVLWKNRNKLFGHPNTPCLIIVDLLVFCHQRCNRHHQQQLRKCLQMNKEECAPLEKQADTKRIPERLKL